MRTPLLIFLPLFTLIHLSSAIAQQNRSSEEFDEIIRLENTDLAYGTEYIEQHIIRNNKHKYFLVDAFQPGSVTYDGQTFKNVYLKYNVFDDLLLIRMKTSGGESIFELFKEKIIEFTIGNHQFKKVISSGNQRPVISGFYEVLLENTNGLVLKKHHKKERKHLDKSFTYYEFKPDEANYIFYQNNIPISIDALKEIRDLVPKTHKEIRRYIQSNRDLFKSDPDKFLITLFGKFQIPYHEP